MGTGVRLASAAFLALLGAGAPAGALPAPEAGWWREIRAADPALVKSCDVIGVDRTGSVWLTMVNSVLRYDGAGWSPATAGQNPLRGWAFRGDSARGLYLVEHSDRRNEGILHPLAGAAGIPSIPFYREDEPGVFVASSGRVFAFAQRTLGVLEGEAWTRVEAPLSDPRQVDVVDMGPGGPVLFFPAGRSTAAMFEGGAIRPSVPIPEIRDIAGRARERTRYARFGKDLVLPWTRVSALKDALRVEGPALSVAELPPAFRGVKVLTVRPDGRGGAWLLDDFVSRDRYPPPPWQEAWGLRHVDSSGKGLPYGFPRGEGACVARSILDDHPFLCAGDGSLWQAVGPRVFRFREGRVRIMGWREGLGAARIHGLAEGPDGTVYASGAGGMVWKWEEESLPDRARLDRWTGVRSRAPVLRDPSGCAWVFPLERPAFVSLVNGTDSVDFPIPSPEDARLRPVYADDGGGLIYENIDSNGAVQVAGFPGPSSPPGVREAVVARVAAGARVFTAYEGKPPVVGTDGRIWMPDPEDRGVSGFMGGRWEEFRIGHVSELAIASDGTTPIALREFECLSYADGAWKVALLPRDGVLRVVGSNPRFGAQMLTPDPRVSAAWRATHVLAGRSPDRSDWRIVSWEAAEPVFRGESTLPGIPTGGNWRPDVPGWARPDGAGGFFGNTGSARVRITEGRVVPAHGAGTPLADASVTSLGFGPRDRLVAVVPLDEWSHEVLMDRTGAPGIRPGPAEVLRGRSVTIPWKGDPPLIAVELREEGTAAWSSFPAPAPATWVASAPGARRVNFEVRGRDSLGLAGSATVVPVDIDAVFPSLRWIGEAPPVEAIEARWRVPVEVEWAHGDIPRVVEVRVDGGTWEPLREDGTILLAKLDHRPVSLDVRAVEEATFASGVLAATVAVEFDLERWIRETIPRAAGGDGQAVRDLYTVRAEALRIVQAMREADPEGARKLRRLESELQPYRD